MNPKIKHDILGKPSVILPATDKKGKRVEVKLPMSKRGFKEYVKGRK